MSSDQPSGEILSEPPESFGEFLKRHREASGKTLDEIARVTRISRRYLDAFENNDESNMPEEAFARGFLKNYANEVGMDLDDCLARFDQFKRSTMPTQIKEARVRSSSGLELGIQSGSSSYKGLALGGAVLVIVVLVFFAFQKFSESPEATTDLEESQESFVDDSSEASTAPSVTPSIVVLNAQTDRTLKVRLDEFAEQEVFLKAGESRSFEVYRKIEFRDPKASDTQESFKGVNFVVNDKPMAKPKSAILPILNQNIISSDDFIRP